MDCKSFELCIYSKLYKRTCQAYSLSKNGYTKLTLKDLEIDRLYVNGIQPFRLIKTKTNY